MIDSDSDSLCEEKISEIYEISTEDESSDKSSSVESSNVKGSSDQKPQVIVIDDEDDSPNLKGSEQKKDVSSDECQMPVLKKEIDCIVLDTSSPDVCEIGAPGKSSKQSPFEPELEPECDPEPELEPECDPEPELESELEQNVTAQESKERKAAALLAQQRRKNRFICMTSPKSHRKRRRVVS